MDRRHQQITRSRHMRLYTQANEVINLWISNEIGKFACIVLFLSRDLKESRDLPVSKATQELRSVMHTLADIRFFSQP